MTLSHRIIFPVVAATALGLAPISHAAGGKVLADVNGEAITQQDYDKFVSQNTNGDPKQINREEVLNEMISRKLVYQDALKQGLDKDPEVLKKLEAIKQSVILGAAMEKVMTKPTIKDSELKKVYDKKLANFNVNELKARHILLKSKSDAEKVITELDMGANFADLAKKKSTGPTSKKGGDLGWFAPQQMVPEFSAAAVKLKKGEYTKKPVQTQFGWHVIKLEDTRKAEPPKFEKVKPQLQKVIQQQRVTKYVKSLRDKGKVDVK